MKRLLILSAILIGGIVAVKAPPTLQGPTLSGSGGGLTSNQVYQIAVTVGGPTNGVTAAVAASIAATNVSQGWAYGVTMPTLTNNTTGNAAVATNLLSTTAWATNQVEDKTRIFVTGTVTPTAARGEYRLVWTNSTGFQGVWTNVTTAGYYIFLNRAFDPETTASFILARGSNSTDTLGSTTQINEQPSTLGSVTFWRNPLDLDLYSTSFYGGEATLTWGTNSGDYSALRLLGTGDTKFPIDYQPGTILFVATNGNDGLASRTNNQPFATLWAANEAAQWGDVIEVLPGYHRTYGIHMKRGVTIRGRGDRTIIEPLPDPDYNHATFFQSAVLSVWDGCTIENLVVTNGAIDFTQHSGVRLGGTNGIIRNVTVYAPYLGDSFPQILQQSYFGYGVKFSRLGDNHRCENVRIYTSAIGFAFQSSVDPAFTNGSTFTLKNCEVIASPEYLGTNNYWLTKNMLGFNTKTNLGGTIPIAFTCGSQSEVFNYGGVTLNIDGGVFQSINGATNAAEYVGGETNTSRNAGLWIARGHTNNIRINFSGVPEFRLANTNTYVNLILNETTNNRVTFSGSAVFKYLPNGDRNAAGTNVLRLFSGQIAGDGGGLTNLISYQSVIAAGTSATSSSSQELMNFGTTRPTLTVSQSGTYEVKATAMGITSDTTVGCSFFICTNNTAAVGVLHQPQSAAIDGFTGPWALAMPATYLNLAAGDVVSLQWQASADNWNANDASISILKIK